MRQKKQNADLGQIQKEYMEEVVAVFERSNSIRAAARELAISPMKLRKILMTAGVYETEMSREIADDENCKHPAVIKSVKVALDKLKEILVD